MRLSLLWVARAAGFLLFVAAVAACLLLLQQGALQGLAFALPLATVGLALWLFGRARLRTSERRRVYAQIRAAAAPATTLHVAPLHANKAVLFTGLLVSLAVALLAVVPAAVVARVPSMAITCAAVALFLLLGAYGPARLAWLASRAGHVLRIDGSGVAHCALPDIPWSAVRGLDLRSRTIQFSTVWYLVLALDPVAIGRVAPSRWRRCTDWQYPPVHRVRGRLEIPLWLVDEVPDAVLVAARTIGARAGVPVDTHFWMGTKHGIAFQRSEILRRERDSRRRPQAKARPA
jgi:hypothetical protein